MKQIIYILIFILVSPLLLVCTVYAVEGFYGYKDKRGVLHLTNVQTDYRYRPLFAKKKKINEHTVRQKIYNLIEKVADKYSVDPEIGRASCRERV